MAGKPSEAKRISKYIGSLGRIDSPPNWYYVFEAAEVLGCSYIELEEHPQKAELMRRAFTYRWGKNEGEATREANPEYQKAIKELSKKIEKARK